MPSYIFASLVVAGLVTVSFVLTLAFWMASEANRQSAQQVRNLVTSATDAISQRVSLNNLDYSHWEEAHNAVTTGDVAWINNNIGTGVSEAGVFQLTQIVDSKSHPSYGYSRKGAKNEGRVMPQSIIDEFTTSLRTMPIGPGVVVSGLAMIDGQYYCLAASHILPSDPNTLDTDAPYVLISGVRFSPERMTEISKEYLVSGLMLMAADGAAPAGYDEQILFSVGGLPVSNLVWHRPRPGNGLLAKALPAIGVMSCILLASFWCVAHRSSGMAEVIVTEREHAQTSARTDSLTGLLNRTGLKEKVKQREINAAIQRGDAAVVYFDLNAFKEINDTEGHDAGDKALRVTAERLVSCVRPGDHVARLGGDEFVCLLLGQNPEAAARGFCQRLRHAMATPVDLNGKALNVGVAVGVSVGSVGAKWEDQLIQSDVAMYHAKRAGGDTPVFFSEDLQVARDWEKSVAERLRSGVEDASQGRSPFRLEFQPVVAGSSGVLVYAEALLRWNDPSLGRVSPDAFIPVAETKGLLPDLGAYVLTECCRLMQGMSDLTVSVNVSPLQLIETDFADRVLRITKDAGIDPQRLIFEVTENALIEVPERACVGINALRDRGFRFALDDFGTGYASINYLKHFPFDTLKIDRSYLAEVETSAQAQAVFATLAQLGQTLGMEVVAEGVETRVQSEAVLQAGCYLHQGYFHARPMSFDALREYIEWARQKPTSVA
ncbi:bifunctional diguanylate cyclase/phosphodiesterase [Roseobacter sp.]|uniref:bifunctional diguanylate cyclase/phosphodiesterase n=1 Tax=Roseobacter sp. TaxID=1907202 RepID=UPI0032970CD9